MESALVRVVFVVQALLLLLLLRIFVIVIIIWAFMQLAYRCRKKQSIIAVRRAEEGEGGREGRHRCHPAMEHLADSPPMSVCGSGPSHMCVMYLCSGAPHLPPLLIRSALTHTDTHLP